MHRLYLHHFIREIGTLRLLRGYIRSQLAYSQIILALLGSGEAYLVDLRKDNRGQVELCEVQEESEDEGDSEAQDGRQRYAGSGRSLSYS